MVAMWWHRLCVCLALVASPTGCGDDGAAEPDAAPGLPDAGDSGIVADVGAPDSGADAGVPAEGMPARLRIETDGATPGGSTTVRWTIDGEAAALELELVLQSPGAPIYGEGSFSLSQGLRPPTGPRRWLDATGAWIDTEARRPAVSGSAATPPLDVDGQWRVLGVLRDPATGNVHDFATASELVADAPAIHLSMNRLAASTTDHLQAEVRLVAGASPADVRVIAWLTLPDGTQRALPGMGAGRITAAFSGTSTDTTIPLLAGSLGALGPGQYQLDVRLVDGATGGTRGVASASFGICDERATLTGLVRPVLPAGAGGGGGPTATFTSGTVRAWDLAEGVWIAETSVDTTGAYTLSLPPGFFVLTAEATDDMGAMAGASRAFMVEGACTRTDEEEDVEATRIVAAASRDAGGRAFFPVTAADYASDGLPRIRVLTEAEHAGPLGRNRATEAYFAFAAELQSRAGADVIVYSREADLQAVLQVVMLTMMIGEDSANALAMAETMFRPDFHAIFSVDTRIGTRIRTRIVDDHHLNPSSIVATVERSVSSAADAPVGTDSTNALLDDLETSEGIVSWRAWLRERQDRPLIPQFTVTPSAERIAPRTSITGRVSLRDVNGAPTEGRLVTVHWQLAESPAPAPPAETATCTTDAMGSCSVTIGVLDRIGVAKMWATFDRPAGWTVRSSEAYVSVESTGALSLSAGRFVLHIGDVEQVQARVRRDGTPVASQTVGFAAMGGTLDGAEAVTDGEGVAVLDFTAGDVFGWASVDANTTIAPRMVTDSLQFWIAPRLDLTIESSAESVGIGESVTLSGSVLAGGVGVAGVEVSLSPARGTTAASRVVTDSNGRWAVGWTAPTAGSGWAVIDATIRVDGTSLTRSVSVQFVDPAMPPPMIAGAYAGTVQFEFECVRCGSGSCSMQPPRPANINIRDLGAGAFEVEWLLPPLAGSGGSMLTYWYWTREGSGYQTGRQLGSGPMEMGTPGEYVSYTVFEDRLTGTFWNRCHDWHIDMMRTGPAPP